MVASALCVFVAAAGIASFQLPTTTVRGTIVDAKTNAPIAEAKVRLVESGGKTVRTGPDGRFEFAEIAPRTYTLTV